MEFGEKIRQAREAKGMTQQSLADKLYVTRQAVSRWECGARYPDLLTAKCVSDILEVSMDELLSGDELKKYSEKQPILESAKAEKIQTLLYAVLSVLVFLNLAQGLICLIMAVAAGEPGETVNLYYLSRRLVFNGLLLGLGIYGTLKTLRQNATPRIVGLIGSLFYLINGIHYLVVPFLFRSVRAGSIFPVLIVSGFCFLYAVMIWQFFANGRAQLGKTVYLFGFFFIAFAAVKAAVNVSGLLFSGLLTHFFYVSFDSVVSVTILCIITAMIVCQARLLSRKRKRQQTVGNR